MPGPFPRSGLLFAVGGDVLAKYGTWTRRYQIPQLGGEGMKEVFTRAGAVGSAIGYLSPGVLGVVPYAQANTPRVEYALDPVTGLVQPYLLLEAARTNAFTKSQKFDDAVWTKTRSSITADVTTAPDGTVTADKLVEDATASATHLVNRNTPALTDNSSEAYSVFVKAAERTWIQLLPTNKAGNVLGAYFDVGNGIIGTIDGGIAARIQYAGNAWWRCGITFPAGVGATTPFVRIGLATGNGGNTYTGNGASGAYIWGAQFETDQAFDSSYIATDAATVTRNADSFSVPWYVGPQAIWIYLRFLERGGVQGSGQDVCFVSSPGASPPWLGWLGRSGPNYSFEHNNGTVVTSKPLVTPTYGQVVELLGLLYADGSVEGIISVNGAAQVTGGRSAANAVAAAWSLPTSLWLNAPQPNTSYEAFGRVLVGTGPGTLVSTIADARAIPV